MNTKTIRLYIWVLLMVSPTMPAPCKADTNTVANDMLQRAVAHRKAGDYSHAISLLTPLRETFMNHKRINIELTLNYIKLRQYDRAEQLVTHLENLTLSKTEQAVVNKLKRVLALQLRRSLTPHTLHFTSTTALGMDIVQNSFPVYTFDDTQQDSEYWSSDDELNDSWVESEFTYVDYGVDEQLYAREEISTKNEVSYISQAFGANYRHRPIETLTWFSYPTQWMVDTDLQAKYKQLDKQNNNKYLSYNIDASVYLIQVNRWLLELNAYAKLDYVDNKKLVNKSRLRAAWTVPFESSKMKFAYDVEQKCYRASLQDYNAKVHIPWLEYSYVFSSQWRISVGAKRYNLNAYDAYNSYNNKQAYVGLYYLPNQNMVTYISYNHYQLKYDIDDPDLVAWSKESKRTLNVGVKYQVDEKLTVQLAGNLGDNRIEMGFGDDNWQRIETSVEYRF